MSQTPVVAVPQIECPLKSITFPEIEQDDLAVEVHLLTPDLGLEPLVEFTCPPARVLPLLLLAARLGVHLASLVITWTED